MNEKFFDLSREKQDRMINGAIEVFAKNGYKHASTDDMVKAVEVSKGLWFHYFDNKKGLYNYVSTYAVRFAALEYSLRVDAYEVDYFALRKNIEEIRMSMSEKYPYLPLFIISLLEEDADDVVLDIEATRIQYREKYRELFHNVNVNAFESPLVMRETDELLNLAFDNILRKKYQSPIFSREDYLDEVDRYLNLMMKINR